MSQSSVMFFTNSTISFEAQPIAADGNVIIPIEGAHFGILNFTAISIPSTQVEQEVVFVVDQSGSMSDICSDGRSKMQHILHTLENMILYFHDHALTNINISVFSFDDNFQQIVERTKITVENLQEICDKIKNIRPLGSTNIEKALTQVGLKINEIMETYPTHVMNHVFMTDGEATEGTLNKNIMKGLVKPDIHNAFIGFGTHHDSNLLNCLASHKKSGYYFIDALEKAGLVYGEVLHSILYKLLTNVEIIIENGLIYDYKKNTWVTNLEVADIVGEANKIYHIASNVPDECQVFIKGIHDKEIFILAMGRLHDFDANYTKYIYRQRTLQLLFEANEIERRKNDNTDTSINVLSILGHKIIDDKEHMAIKKDAQQLKQKMREFFEELKKYMNDNHWNEDKFLKNLCDDIFISYQTFGTKFGGMYTSARQTSQGTQRCYTVSQTPKELSDPCDDVVDDNHTFPFNSWNHATTPRQQSLPPNIRWHRSRNIRRAPANTNTLDDFAPDIPILHHHVSDFDDTPYLTPTATRMMRDVSCGPSHEENKEDDIFVKLEEEEESQIN